MCVVTSWPVTLVRAISVYLLLISRLCACVVRYVSAGWEIERDEGREAITHPLLLWFHENLNYNYCARYLQQHQTLLLWSKASVSGLKTSPTYGSLKLISLNLHIHEIFNSLCHQQRYNIRGVISISVWVLFSFCEQCCQDHHRGLPPSQDQVQMRAAGSRPRLSNRILFKTDYLFIVLVVLT